MTKKYTLEEIRAIIEENQKWLDSDGKLGKKSNITLEEFLEATAELEPKGSEKEDKGE